MGETSSQLSGLSVCVVTVNYAPETTGIAPYATAFARTLSKAGADVTVVGGVPHYPSAAVQAPYDKGMRWVEADGDVVLKRRRHIVAKEANLKGRAGTEGTFLAHALPTVWRDKSDIVVSFSPHLAAAMAADLGKRGRPTGIIVQDLVGNGAMQSGTTGGGAGEKIAKQEYKLLRKAARVGVITPRFGEIAVANGIDASRIDLLPNFTRVAPSDLSKLAARRACGFADDEFLVLHTGNMGMKQGLDVVIEAARLADAKGTPIKIVLMGDGNQRAVLQAQAAGIKSLEFRPFVDEDVYPHVLASADILLVNEKAGVEEMSLPSKLTSYVSAGRPLVAAVEPGGITGKSLTQYDAALMVEPGSAEKLLGAIEKVRTGEADTEALITNAKIMGREEYSEEAAEERYRNFAARLALHR